MDIKSITDKSNFIQLLTNRKLIFYIVCDKKLTNNTSNGDTKDTIYWILAKNFVNLVSNLLVILCHHCGKSLNTKFKTIFQNILSFVLSLILLIRLSESI